MSFQHQFTKYKDFTIMVEEYMSVIYQQKDIFRPYPFSVIPSKTWSEIQSTVPT